MDTGAGLLAEEMPIQPTPLLDRAIETGDVSALLGRDDVRLVTLTGPGGIGKTRIAIEVAERLRDAYPGGDAHPARPPPAALDEQCARYAGPADRSRETGVGSRE